MYADKVDVTAEIDILHQDVDNILRDPSVSSEELHERAQEYLAILEDPLYSSHNVPHWVQRIASVSGKTTTFTTKRMFDVVYEAASRLGLEDGKRYVSASVCSCARAGIAGS